MATAAKKAAIRRKFRIGVYAADGATKILTLAHKNADMLRAIAPARYLSTFMDYLVDFIKERCKPQLMAL